MTADKEAAYLRTWKAIHDSYTRYSHCDDGAIATGYTESVVQTLKASATLQELGALARRDPAFEAFVLRHIAPTASPADLQEVEAVTRNRCPKGLEALCRKLANAASQALAGK